MKIWPIPRKKAELIVLRMSDYLPQDAIKSRCCKCDYSVLVFPSSQRVIRKMGPELVDLICVDCGSVPEPKPQPSVHVQSSFIMAVGK